MMQQAWLEQVEGFLRERALFYVGLLERMVAINFAGG